MRKKELNERIRVTDDIMYAYLETALWASTNPDTGENLDRDYSIIDFDEESEKKVRKDLKKFFSMAEEYLNELDVDVEQVVHDFWLTRNGHGAGFWDRPEVYGDYATELSKIAHTFGESYVFPDEEGGLAIIEQVNKNLKTKLNNVIEIQEEVEIPRTDIVLEKGDKIIIERNDYRKLSPEEEENIEDMYSITRYIYNLVYDTTTSESTERGEFEDRGFIKEDEQVIGIEELADDLNKEGFIYSNEYVRFPAQIDFSTESSIKDYSTSESIVYTVFIKRKDGNDFSSEEYLYLLNKLDIMFLNANPLRENISEETPEQKAERLMILAAQDAGIPNPDPEELYFSGYKGKRIFMYGDTSLYPDDEYLIPALEAWNEYQNS